MNKTIITILQEIEERAKYGLTIPELHLEFEVKDKVIAAYALSLISDEFDYLFDPVEFTPTTYAATLIEEIVSKIEMLKQEKIHFVAIYGQNAATAYSHFEDKFSKHIINKNDCTVVVNEGYILVPIKSTKYEIKDLETLSLLGVSVIDFDGQSNILYSQGSLIESSNFEFLAYVAYANSLGWLIQDYIFAEMMYAVKTLSTKVYDVLLSNTTCKLVQSLVSIMAEPYFNELNTNWFQKSDLKILVELIKNSDFHQIKDYPFEFVKRYFNENEKA